jgi:LmbE family N-acetylglucosaminyl deacetylase
MNTTRNSDLRADTSDLPALRLLVIGAHPDDETLGNGGALAKYAAEGVETYVLTATRGEKGWFGAPEEYPGAYVLGAIRETELRAAAGELGVRNVTLLDYVDGELDEADPDEAIAQIARHIRIVRPQVVITFAHDGLYGHPDHIAISQFATAAIVAAADSAYDAAGVYPAHRVSKLYYRVADAEAMALYEGAFGELVMHVDGEERRTQSWTGWTITTEIETGDHWRTVWNAAQQHRSQLPAYERLAALSDDEHRAFWRSETYYRAFSSVNGGRAKERDLFEGLREPAAATSSAGAAGVLAAYATMWMA